MSYLIISIGILIFFGYFLWLLAKRPLRHQVSAHGDFSRFLEALLYRGYNRGFLIVEAPTKERFIQFLKYIGPNKNVGLRFDFPNAPWSAKYFEKLQDLLTRRNYKYEIQLMDSLQTPNHNRVTEFLAIDLKQDIVKANELVRLCLLGLFELKPNETVSLYFIDVSPKDEKIGF